MPHDHDIEVLKGRAVATSAVLGIVVNRMSNTDPEFAQWLKLQRLKRLSGPSEYPPGITSEIAKKEFDRTTDVLLSL